MAKKIVIPKGDLPNLIAGETQCFLRFRVVSEDRNRVSAWTPIFGITPTVAYTNAITTLQSDVDALQTDVSTAQGDITSLEGSVTTIEGDVVNLFNISDDNFAISVVL